MRTTMRAMVLAAPRRLALTDIQIPTLVDDEILVRVTHTGICGTDAKIYSGAIAVDYPRIMGHEVVGKVVESNGHETFKTGVRVVVDPAISCGTCFHCRVGQTNLCPNGALLGRDADGGFADFIACPAQNLIKLPDSIHGVAAPLLQVASTCVHAQSLVPLQHGDSVAVLGLGVTGQLHLQLAKARGANPVIGITRSPFRRLIAKQLGLDLALDGGDDSLSEVLNATSGRGADLVIECTGSMDSVARAIQMVRIGGRILLFGISAATQATLPFYQLYSKELTIYNARSARPEDFTESMALVERHALKLEELITHPVPFHQLEHGIQLMEHTAEDRLKVIVEHN